MNKITQFYSKSDIQEQACLWVTRIDRGLTDTEQSKLFTWIELSNNHQLALFEVASHWDNLSILDELNTLFPLNSAIPSVKRKWQNIALVASIAVFSIILTVLVNRSNFFPVTQTSTFANTASYSTKIGEQARYLLSDGSSVQLNTNSRVEIDFSANYRKLTLIRGEARFDVAKDINRPFIVSSGMQKFTALGTVFNVQKNNQNHVELLVTEGRVLLSKTTPTSQDMILSMSAEQQSSLGDVVTSGQKVVVDKNTISAIEQISLEYIQRDLAWQQGMLIFNGEPLNKALAEVNRYSQQKIKIVDPQLANIPISGYFTTNSIDELIAALTANFNLAVTHIDDNTIGLKSKVN
jgi:transmembrane sensor